MSSAFFQAESLYLRVFVVIVPVQNKVVLRRLHTYVDKYLDFIKHNFIMYHLFY